MGDRKNSIYTDAIRIQGKRVQNEIKHLQVFTDRLAGLAKDDPGRGGLESKARELASMLPPDAELLLLLLREYGALLAKRGDTRAELESWAARVEEARELVFASDAVELAAKLAPLVEELLAFVSPSSTIKIT